MHDPAPKGMAHCSHSSIRAPQGPAHFPTVRRTVGTGRDADRPDVLFSSPMAHRVQLSRRLDKRKTPCFPARRLRGAADRIRTCGLSGRSPAPSRKPPPSSATPVSSMPTASTRMPPPLGSPGCAPVTPPRSCASKPAGTCPPSMTRQHWPPTWTRPRRKTARPCLIRWITSYCRRPSRTTA